MFDYFGSKQELAHLYPAPRHDLIVEAFAGSASYALHGDHWRRDVILLERNEALAAMWQWLIDEASANSIGSLPELHVGHDLTRLPAPMRAVVCPVASVDTVATVATVASWERSRAAMAANVGKVKHWQVVCGDSYEAPRTEATWFVDPPYRGPVGSGYAYGSSSIDFGRLAEWVRSLPGQVIACESGCATYLPFVPLRPGIDCQGDEHAEFVWHGNHHAGSDGGSGPAGRS